MDIANLFKARQAWDVFRGNHPKFPEFLKALKARGACEGAEVLISVTYPDGQQLKSGIKLKQSDVELINNLAGMV